MTSLQRNNLGTRLRILLWTEEGEMLVFVGQAAAKMEIYIRKPASVWSMSLTDDYQCKDDDDVDDCGDGKS